VEETILKTDSRTNALFSEGCRLQRLDLNLSEIHNYLRILDGILAKRDSNPPLERHLIRLIAEEAQKVTVPVSDVYHLTQTGDAEFFVALNTNIVVFDHLAQEWMLFNGNHWVRQTDGEIHRLARDTIFARQRAAKLLNDDSHLEWAMKGESRGRQSSLLKLAETMKPVAVAGVDLWDQNHALLGVQNGVVDLRTGLLRPGAPEDRITRVSPLSFNPDIPLAVWTQFILDVSNDIPDLAEYLQTIFGYSLTGEVNEQVFWIFYGEGANGKGTLIETIMRKVIPNHSKVIDFPANDWTASLSNYVRAGLAGRRLVVSDETEPKKHLSAKLIKSFTGSNTVAARHPYGRPFNFQPVAKFIIVVNHLPIIEDDTHAMWRRVREVPFLRKFEVSDFGEKLKLNEAEAALTWAVQGAIRYYKEGFKTPQIVIETTNNYRKSLNSITRFFEDCCVFAEDKRIGVKALYTALIEWYDSRNATLHERMTQPAFLKYMSTVEDVFKMEGKGTKEQNRQFYHGIDLKPVVPIVGVPPVKS
jgi:putative DNA primase/helicase